jgi:Amino acid transporters
MTTQSSAVDTSLNQHNLKRTITTPQALGISFHQIVGGGVVSLTGIAIALTGGGVSVAFLLAAIAVMIVSIPYASLGATMPVTGGTYTYATKLLHPAMGFVNMWLFVISMASLSLYGLTAGTYLHSLNPWFDPTVVCVTLITIFYIANLMGSSFSAKIGIVLALVMLVAFATFIVMGLLRVDWPNYPTVMPNGLPKLLQASALLTFATGGGTVVAELGHEMKTPGKSIPLAVIGGTAFAAVLYILIALPAAGVLPIAQVAGQPLSVVAKEFMPTGVWLFFILGGAVLAVIGTMNAQLLWGSKSVLAAVDDGWFPKKVGSVNKRFGTPHYLLTFMFLVGIVPAVTHISVSVIASAASAIGQILFIIILIAALRLRYIRPQLLAASPFKLGAATQWVLTVLGCGVCAYQTYLLTQGLTPDVWITLLIWLGLGAVWFAIRYPTVKRLMAARADQVATITDSQRTISGTTRDESQLISMGLYDIPKVGSFEGIDELRDEDVRLGDR